MAPKTLSNKVNPLTWNVPIVDTKTGNPTPEFQRKWQQQAAANASVTDLTTAKAVSAVIDLISSTVGALLVRGASQWTGLVPVADGRVLRDKGAGATPIWDTISSIIDTLGAVQGDVLYRDAAAWKVLAPGTAGQVLTTGGPAANPSWQTSSAGGGAVSSVNDDGTNFYLALMDVDGQLILDGSGDPVFIPEVLPTAAIPSAAGYVTGPRSAEVVGKVKGVTDGSSAAAGDVGELLSAILPFASAVLPATGVSINITSLLLTPGDWDVTGVAAFFPGTLSAVSVAFGLSTTTGTLPSVTTDAQGSAEISTALSQNASNVFGIPPIQFNVTVNTTIFLVVSATFSGAGTAKAWGTIRARRIR